VACELTPGVIKLRVRWLAVFVTFLLVSRSWAIAIVDDFNDGNNAGWTDASPLAGLGAPTTYTYPGGNTYNIKVGASPNPSAVGPSRGGSIRADATYTQFGAKVDVLNWDFGGGTRMIAGVLARVHNIGLGTTNGYGFTYDTVGTLYLSRITGEVPTTLASTPLALTSGTGYQFYFSGTGSDFIGQVYALSNLEVPLVTLNASDATYTSGVNAILVYDSAPTASANHTPSATFDNYASDVSVVPGPPGDYNRNGKVDSADYVLWRDGLGTIYVQNDYDVWRAHFGEAGGSGAGAGSSATGSATAAPEPATLVTFVMAMLVMCARRRAVDIFSW
jgi:hypothetical protein